jgi:hypothetical protein
MSDEWIVIPNWDRFQHYKDRDPPWIKLYTDLAHREEWLDLTMAERGLLVTIWIEYARSGCTLGANRLRRLLHRNYRTNALEPLIDAGFITVVASKPLAARYHDASPETEEENYIRSSLPTVVKADAPPAAPEGAAGAAPTPSETDKPKPRRSRKCNICGITLGPNVSMEDHRRITHGIVVRDIAGPAEPQPEPAPKPAYRELPQVAKDWLAKAKNTP